VFTSDNGGVSAGDGKATSNLPLRGGKGRQWEGGIREPYYIYWPGVTKSGSISDTPVTGTDFYPTLCEIAGMPSRPDQHVDGLSLVSLLKGDSPTGTALATRPLYWHYPHYGNQGGEPSSILREQDWKLIHYYEDGRNELYNLVDDPGEQQDVAAIYPNQVTQMDNRLTAWLTETGARMPVKNPNFDEQELATWQENIRTKYIASLEAQHAAVVRADWQPSGGWWVDEKKRQADQATTKPN